MVRGKKRKNIVLIIAFAIFTCYIGYELISLQIHIHQQNEALATLQQLCAEKKISNEELNHILENGDVVEYVEKIARENGYVDPDEQIYIDISGN